MQFLKPTSDLLNQKLWVWGPAIRAFTSMPGESDVWANLEPLVESSWEPLLLLRWLIVEFYSENCSCLTCLRFDSYLGIACTQCLLMRRCSPLPWFSTTLKGYLNSRAPHRISWGLCCKCVAVNFPLSLSLLHQALPSKPPAYKCPYRCLICGEGI